ncbi:MAG: peptidoglycan bridge formation glycyltransferase FemA/FemB family protein [Ardenticatenaceae bacterium]|nr:peptidoglycan bridge formation glycyltransferase FemA/FemB family protein [Anaerolineales bacterium]MCB8937613.1 peptidoglycan bridge formation glycyltransferase FemA/FemB family protein [Ardenticatenaceae bacterium]MCB8974182.1 peptidoglycan bridge formation glycyltransferase FemA/FemB family protein [Ardenticatenaceae bacterium]
MLDKFLEIGERPYNKEDAEWDEFVANHPHGSILQTTNWARLKNRFGWTSHRVWMRKDGELIAGAQVLYRSVAAGLVKMAYIPHGPMVDWDDAEQVAVLFNQIDQSAYDRGASILKMEPLLWQSEAMNAKWQAICQKHNLLPNTDTIQPPNTVLIDLRPSPDEILANMKQKTRYNIRLAAKKEVTVRQGGLADIAAFNKLMRVTGERDQFGVHTPMYYHAAYEIFAPMGQCALFLAEFEERPLAGVMVFALGKTAAYLYGASSNEERQRMPTYAVQWAAMEWAKEQGCHWYDLWGVPDAPEEELEGNFSDRNDGLWGVYRFKRGFGGNIQRTIGATDRIYNKLVYKLYQWRRGR